MTFSSSQVSGLILAGGRGRRMDGQDKGLVNCAGRPLIEYALDTLKPLCNRILINANRSLEDYRRFGHPVISDGTSAFDGPLAGILAGLKMATTPYLMAIPCDCPRLTPQTLTRMLQTLRDNNAEICIPHDGNRPHPVIMVLQTRLRASLEAQLAAGERKIDCWTQKHHTVLADCSQDPEQFLNINSPQQLKAMENFLKTSAP